MIRSNVVSGVMSFEEMDAMMYKIEGEDLYLIGTSEHSMIGKFIDTITPEEQLPLTLTSYSPCFRKEKGAHGIEERGIYRIHQFEKQEMIVVCKPEESMEWFNKMWSYSVELFRSMDNLCAHSNVAQATLPILKLNLMMLRLGVRNSKSILKFAHALISAMHKLADLAFA